MPIPEQQIPCPVCNTPIPFNTRDLLMGVQFTCKNCHTAIGLAQENKPKETIYKIYTDEAKIRKLDN